MEYNVNNNNLHYQMTQNGWVRLSDTNSTQKTGALVFVGRLVLNYGVPVIAGIVVILRVAGLL